MGTRINRHLLAASLALCAPASIAAQFVYEGRLDDAGRPANGRYDLKLAAFGHEAQGTTLAAPVTLEGVEVVDGRFRVEVDLPLVTSDQVWLEVAVRGAGEPVFAGIPGRSKAIAAPLIGACWSTTGDSGSNQVTNFLGTTDNQPLLLRVNNRRVVRIEPTEGSPNLIGGLGSNSASANVQGATISGGGVEFFPNRVTDNFGTVGGGRGNRAGDNLGGVDVQTDATVSGGRENVASGLISTVAGGLSNDAVNTGSTVSGGQFNVSSGQQSTVGGGQFNNARGLASTVTGGQSNCAGGDSSWAGGRRAIVRPAVDPGAGTSCSGLTYPGGGGDAGTFVWADSQTVAFVSTGSNQFLVRAAGGAGIGTNAPEAALHVNGSLSGATALFSDTGTAVVRMRSDPTGNTTVTFNDTNGLRGSITAFPGSTLTIGSEGRVQMRTGGNTTRFQLSETGSLSLARGPFNADLDKAIQVGTNTGNGNGAHLTITGVWTNASSRHFKQAFEAIDAGAVLAGVLRLPVTTWSYRGEETVRHLGPTAEDFHAAFGLGADARYIGSVDASGVALAAIQGLNAKLEAEREALRAENGELRVGQDRLSAENAALRARIDRLESLLGERLTRER